MSLAYRLARRDLRGSLKSFRIFLACLILGVAAIAAVGTVRSAITAGLKEQGAALLGGDAEAEFTYRFARPEELAYLQSISEQVSETVDFRSMVVVQREETERALTQVRAVDDLYPLIGEVTLSPEMPLADAFAGNGDLPGGVMERVLADRLGLSAGDTFRLGTQDFVLSAVLDTYPDNAAGGFGLGPRTLVLTEDLADAGLIAEGTLFNTQYRLDLPDGADLAALERQTEGQWRDSGLRWRDARRGAGGTERFVQQIGSFLILVGLAGLAVGGVGVSAAVRSYLAGKRDTIATLKTLGAERRTILAVYAIQIAVLSAIGIVAGLVLGLLLPLVFSPLIAAQLPVPASFRIYPMPLAEAAIYGALTAAIFTLLPIARTENIRAAALFRNQDSGRLPFRHVLYTGILVAALVALAAWFTDAVRLTLYTFGGIAGALLVLAIAAWLIGWIAGRLNPMARGRPALRAALAAIAAQKGETLSVVLSLGLGLSVLASVGQIDGNLRAAFTDELPSVAPSYFFVDIQPDQMEGFRERLDNDPAVSKVEAAPMLRGIITTINGQPAEEFANGHWVVRGDRGVTYSEALPEGTRLTAGEWWPEGYDGEPLVSFSAEEAAEIGLQLGDTLTVNILGRDITATVASFRKVEFDTAAIGFVMSMNPAALAGAPHSWISTVYAEEDAEAAILRDLANAYPNITAIRVRDAIDQALVLVDGIAAGVRYGALATLVTGFLVLIGAAAAGQRARVYEASILKTLGATRGTILRSFALRAAFVGFAAGVVALFAGIGGGWTVTTYIMDTDFQIIWSNALWIIAGGIVATLLANLTFALRALSVRPARNLRDRE